MTAFAGAGPGHQTDDGCSVEVYRQLPYLGELEACKELLRPGTTVLELGCGTGRLSRPLLALGCAVTAVDSSSEMLAHVPCSARTIRADIEDLRLEQRFDVVLLASRLMNHGDSIARRGFIGTAAAHVAPKGNFIFECTSSEWLQTVEPGPIGDLAGFAVSVIAVARRGSSVAMTLKYEKDACVWTHSFTACALNEKELSLELAKGGFGGVRWLDERRRWARASLRRY